MRIHVERSEAILDLGHFLRTYDSAVVDRSDGHALEVSLLGSYSNRAMAERIGAAIEEWLSDGPATACRVQIDAA